jgi:hypothetical protein
MQLNILSRLILLLILILTLAACGGNSGVEVDGISLSQSISSSEQENGVTTVYYPDGWVGEESWLGIYLYSSPELLETDLVSSSLQSGEVRVLVFTGLADEEVPGLTTESSPMDYIEVFLSDNSGNGDQLGDIEEFDADDRPAAIVFGTITEDDQIAGIIITVTKIGDAFGILTFITNENEVDDNVALAKAITTKLEFVQD